jgi:hypothetical protein
LRGVLDGRPIQELAASLCEQRLHFTAHFGIGFGQQRRALFAVLSRAAWYSS